MSHPQQEQCKDKLKQLAGSSELRIVNRNGTCHVFVSDYGAQVLKESFGLEPVSSEHVIGLFSEYNLGRTPHHIARADLTAIIGRFGLGEALNEVRGFIPRKQAAQGPIPD